MKRTSIVLSMFMALLSVTVMNAQTDIAEKMVNLQQYRVDFLNSAGERIFSEYANRGVTLFDAFSKGDDTFVFVVNDSYPSKIQVIPPGGTYPATVVTEEGVKVSISVIGPRSNRGTRVVPSSSLKSESKMDLQSGDTLRFTIDISELAFPTLSIGNEYTGDRFEDTGDLTFQTFRPALVDNLMSPAYHFTSDYHRDAEYRHLLVEWEKGYSYFDKDPNVKGRWSFDMIMPNEPMTVKIGYDNPDAEMLNRAVSNAAQMIYCAQTYSSAPTFFNGDPWTMMVCETLSGDCVSNRSQSNGNMLEFLSKPGTVLHANSWIYYMGMVDMVNKYLEEIPRIFTAVSDSDKSRAEAQLRTLRAHALWRILQLYGPRWQDSKNGSMPIAPLYKKWGEFDLPLSTFKEILDYAVEDLEYAIQWLSGVKYDASLLPDEYVARGTRVRLAMVAEDWMTVSKETEIILAHYPLTTNEELKNGFCNSAPSWIWTASCPVDLMGYYSYQSSAAVNGAYTLFWRNGSMVGSIDRQLFNSIPETDIRRSMFVMPETLGIDVADFYKRGTINSTKMTIEGSAVYDAAFQMIKDYQPPFIEEDWDDVLSANGYPSTNFFFGNQMKLWGHETGNFSEEDVVCLMRADEMLLSRAEALCNLGDLTGATYCLNRLKELRNPDQLTPSKDPGLLDEIRLNRRIELWGEGHSFFDSKRWNVPVVRKEWISGDTNSGNWPPNMAGTFSPDSFDGFRFVLPLFVVEDNDKIDLNSLGYSDPSVYFDDEEDVEPTASKVPEVKRLSPKQELNSL